MLKHYKALGIETSFLGNQKCHGNGKTMIFVGWENS
jgi:hypothetical protein